ncbi:hypothetical protein [Poriferisphaera sp. WC338]|uniref:hypothetical protein n=1 Tax=Poriferisphaera sp. WC338 TaxID=3425129 RepID=UPI003D81409F
MRIYCPECKNPLRATSEIAGHKVKCSMCQTEFVAPEVDDIVEDTVSSWLEEDFEEVMEEMDQHAEQHDEELMKMKSVDKKDAAPKSKRYIKFRSTNQWADKDDDLRSQPSTTSNQPERTDDEDLLGDSSIDGIEISIIDEEAERRKRREARRLKRESQGNTTPSSTSKSARYQTASSTAPQSTPEYDQNPACNKAHPKLIVQSIDRTGVTIGFDSIWLRSDLFCASMPRRCIYNGCTDKNLLAAKPMIFADQSRVHEPEIEKLARPHYQAVIGSASTGDLAHIMGPIETMPKPYQNAVPYYLSADHEHENMRCWTEKRADGGRTCLVHIKDHQTAHLWLGRVNGICDKAYHQMTKDISMLHGGVWREMSDKCRARLQTWCKLNPKEDMLLYLSDADFGKSDQGLAGVVVTSSRIVYNKYHHGGEIERDSQEAIIQVKCDKTFAHLSLFSGTDRHRMVKLHRSDVDRLVKELSRSTDLRVTVKDTTKSTGTTSSA